MNKKMIPLTLAIVMVTTMLMPSCAVKGSDTSPTGVVQTDQSVQELLDNYFMKLEVNRNFSGQVLVTQNGKLLLSKSYGYSDYEQKIKVTNETTFSIGSVTKQFTAACVAKLVEGGKVSFDDPISKYIKDVPHGDEITIHQLLTHTSGLFNYTNTKEFVALKLNETSYDNLIKLIADKPLDFEPGTKMSYSNTGYLVLSKLVENVSGQKLQDYMSANIFEPVGMTHTGVSYAGDKKLVNAKGYSGYLKVEPDTFDPILLNVAYGAGFLCSTAEDMQKWDVALQSGKVVNQESLNKLFGTYTEAPQFGSVGYGWFTNDSLLGKEIAHGGNTTGFTALNALYPDQKVNVVILVNKQSADLQSLAVDIQKMIKGEQVKTAEPYGNLKLEASELSKYAGTFEVDGEQLVVKIEGDKLILERIQGMPLNVELSIDTKNKLYSNNIQVDLEYTFDESGIATSIMCNFAGQNQKLTRASDKQYLPRTKAQLEALTGTYEIKGLFKLNVFEQDNKLMIQAEGQSALEVKAISETIFEAASVGAVFEFDSKEKPKTVILKQAGQEFTGDRIE